jgi:methylthioribose-1-phosphate isomerase
VTCIRDLKVRGAPLIGIAAALSLAQLAEQGATVPEIVEAASRLREARPTAVNLMAAVDRVVLKHRQDLTAQGIVARAEALFAEDVALCSGIAKHGSSLLADGDHVLTHCNTGGLATVGSGTALAVIAEAARAGKCIHVFVDETRPLLQGARLTAWELSKLEVPFTLICDNMAAFLMKQGKVQKVLVGCDRIACNGDFANKVGTYGLAVAAKYHRIPFYVAAPWTTVDLNCRSGEEIPIEERGPEEVRAGQSPRECAVYNPAFDVTPAELVTGFIFDRGVVAPRLIQEFLAGLG